MTWQQKSDLIQNYPVICTRNFEHMVQLFIEDVLKSNLMPIGEMVDLFQPRVGFHTGNVENVQAYVNLNSQLVNYNLHVL